MLGVSQALRQAASMARILAYPLTSQDVVSTCCVSMFENGPWLMDAFLDLRFVQKRWDLSYQSSPIPLIEIILDMKKDLDEKNGLVPSIRDKAGVVLVLLCSEMVSSPGDLILMDSAGEKTRLSYCLALIAITKISRQSYSVARLAASKLVKELTLLSSQFPAIGEGTDIWVRSFVSSMMIIMLTSYVVEVHDIASASGSIS